jgi:hypothetical protein
VELEMRIYTHENIYIYLMLSEISQAQKCKYQDSSGTGQA